MIVYGTANKELVKEMVAGKCQHCGTQNSVDLHLFQKYAHVFWIPFFPIGKTAVSQCSNCKQILKLKEMPPPLKDVYENLKTQFKTPVWMFSGLALVFILIVAAILSGKKNEERNASLIKSPKSGDIFEIKTKDNQYTAYKVVAVENDSAFVKFNNYETDKASGLSELKEKSDTSYSNEMYGFSKAELKQMLDKGEIINVNRK
jgi:zinc-ribbon family